VTEVGEGSASNEPAIESGHERPGYKCARSEPVNGDRQSPARLGLKLVNCLATATDAASLLGW
jgi:hypothetical protein